MQLNRSKTKIINHWSNKSDQSIVNSIKTVNSTERLGVLISDDLKWINRIDTTGNKVIPYFYTKKNQ